MAFDTIILIKYLQIIGIAGILGIVVIVCNPLD